MSTVDKRSSVINAADLLGYVPIVDGDPSAKIVVDLRFVFIIVIVKLAGTVGAPRSVHVTVVVMSVRSVVVHRGASTAEYSDDVKIVGARRYVYTDRPSHSTHVRAAVGAI